jgi:hypothetical protein
MVRLLGQRRERILQHFDWKKGGLRQRLCRRRSGSAQHGQGASRGVQSNRGRRGGGTARFLVFLMAMARVPSRLVARRPPVPSHRHRRDAPTRGSNHLG